MKKNSPYILALLIFALLLIQCKKDEQHNSSINLSNESGMNIVNYDTLIWGGYNKPVAVELDLDRNGQNDIRLVSNQPGSLGSGVFPIAQIQCLNGDFGLAGLRLTDTTFVHWDTSYVVSTGHVSVYCIRYLTCERSNKKDSVEALIPNHFNLKDFGVNDVIKQTGDFHGDTFTLGKTQSIFGVPELIGVSNDSTFYLVNRSLDNCYSMPNGVERYLAFKRIGSNQMGWIKLTLIDHFKIHLKQTAIQKY